MIPKSKFSYRKEYKEFINKVMTEREKYVVFIFKEFEIRHPHWVCWCLYEDKTYILLLERIGLNHLWMNMGDLIIYLTTSQKKVQWETTRRIDNLKKLFLQEKCGSKL